MRTLDTRALFAATLAVSTLLPVFGQAPATCTTAPQPPTAFLVERTLSLANVLSTRAANINPSIQAAVQSGALEIRQQFSLNATTNVISVTVFAATPGSTSPTTPSNINFGNVLSSYSFSVTQTQTSCKPAPSILYAGVVTQNYPVDPYGDLTAVPGMISAGLTVDTPPKINNVVFVAAGVEAAYSASGVGTVTFATPLVNPPGTNASAPVVVFSPAATQATSSKQLGLDASKSTSPLGLQLSFSWRQVNTNVSAALSNANTATPTVTFAGRGDYIFEVTVTDSKGNSTVAQTTISFVGNGS